MIKNIVARTYKPVLEKYLSQKRVYHYRGIELEIPPEVFHPGFFSSTQILLQYILKLPLENKKFLELGAGSGLISMVAARNGADVCATDINPVALEYLEVNSRKNNVPLKIIRSNLFDNISQQQFDIIAINPPYYKKKPHTLLDHAWYCGENGEYFSKLFQQLAGYIHHHSEIVMVLCDGCDIEMIKSMAESNRFSLSCIQIKQTLIEKNFIFKVELPD